MAKTYGEAALEVARREIGVKEDPPGSNTGPRVSVYLKNVPIIPSPWCATFVTWCLEQVGWERGDWNVAYCPSWVQAAKDGKNDMQWLTSRPEVGDLALYDWQGDGTSDHIGIVESTDGLFNFTAIEGNTAVGNDSNGGEVMYRTRTIHDVAGFIRLPDKKVPLPTRLRAAKYGAKTVPVIMDRLRNKLFGDVPNPRDREHYQRLRQQGLGHESAVKVIKTLRKKRK